MDFTASPSRDLSFLVTGEEARKLYERRGNHSYMDENNSLTFVGDAEAMSGAVLGCSESGMFEKIPLVNGIQVMPPESNDQIWLVNIRPAIVKTLLKEGEYKARYSPDSEAVLEIRRKG